MYLRREDVGFVDELDVGGRPSGLDPLNDVIEAEHETLRD
jgi:hypothetical protein